MDVTPVASYISSIPMDVAVIRTHVPLVPVNVPVIAANIFSLGACCRPIAVLPILPELSLILVHIAAIAAYIPPITISVPVILVQIAPVLAHILAVPVNVRVLSHRAHAHRQSQRTNRQYTSSHHILRRFCGRFPLPYRLSGEYQPTPKRKLRPLDLRVI
jgi:hypothetical protein